MRACEAVAAFDVVPTAEYERSLGRLQLWPEAERIHEVLVMHARVRPRWGRPLDGPWRGLRSRPYGDCPALLLQYRLDDRAVVLGPVGAYGCEEPPQAAGGEEAGSRGREFIAWLNGDNRAAADGVSQLLAIPPHAQQAWLAAHPELHTFHFFELLAGTAYEQLARDPARAGEIATLALRFVHGAALPLRYRHLLLFLHGRLWRERANALRALKNLPSALAAYEQSVRVMESFAPMMSEGAAARRGAALARHQLRGPVPDALRAIRESAAVFRETLETGELILSLQYEGHVQFDARRFAEARAVFAEALKLAELIGDEITAAHAHVNLGQCGQELALYDEAMVHFNAALSTFEKHGMVAERPHVTWGIAFIFADQGDPDTAFTIFDRTATDFRLTAKLHYAAEAALDALRMLIRQRRWEDAEDYMSRLSSALTSARLLGPLERVPILKAAARAHTLTEEQVEAMKTELVEV